MDQKSVRLTPSVTQIQSLVFVRLIFTSKLNFTQTLVWCDKNQNFNTKYCVKLIFTVYTKILDYYSIHLIVSNVDLSLLL